MRPSRVRGNIAVLLAVCLVALAGCAGPTGPGILGGGTCSLEPVARVPVRLYSGLPLVDATIAGAPVRLVLDTGADRTLLSEAAVRRLGLPRDPHRTSRSTGVGGAFGGFDALTNTITLGGTTLPLPRVVVGDFDLGFSDTQVDGLLGADLWRHFDVDLNLPARTATLYRAQFCHRSAPPWPGPAITVEGLAGPPTRLLLPVALDGKGAAAIFDTGAQVTAVSTRLAARVPEPADPGREVRLRGAGAATARLRARRFASLQIGPLLFADPVLPVMPLPGIVGAVVGEDLLRGCRAWFSFAARQLFLAAADVPRNAGGQITLACPPTSP